MATSAPASDVLPAPAPRPGADPQLAQHRQVQAAIWVCYLVDALLLVGFWAAGSLPAWPALLFVGLGTLICGLSAAAYGAAWWRPAFADPLVATNVGLASALQLLVAVQAPQVGLLMMLTVVLVVATSSLRLSPRWLWPTIAVVGTAMAVVMTAEGPALAAPSASWPERALTALWCLWTLAKVASVNVAGTQLRQQLAEALTRLETLATHDELTGLANRRHILELLEVERERMRRTGLPFGVALLDIDHFKRINDTHGHATGDAVLREVAQVLRHSLRTPDRPGRLGGEEFLLLLHGPLQAAGAAQVGERLRAAIEGHDWGTLAPGLQVSACLGVAISQPDEPAAALVERADRLLYECKRGGRNQVRVG